MKTMTTTLALLVVASVCFAGPFKLSLTNIDTNSTPTTTNLTETYISGDVTGVYFDLSGADTTCTVTIATTTNGSVKAARTLLTVPSLSADGYYALTYQGYVSNGDVATNGFVPGYPLWGDKVGLTVNDSGVTNANLDAYIFMK